MKKCPNCGELVGDNVDTCFKCSFDFNDKDSLNKVLIQKQQERQAAKEQAQRELRTNNNLYEYCVVEITDDATGESNVLKIGGTLQSYAQRGWRLHSIYTNEIGKTVHPQALSIGSINATIDQTIMVFERIVAKEL